MEYFVSSCPLCGHHDAKYLIEDHGMRRDYLCPNCKRFVITEPAERQLKGLPNLRRQFAEESKALGALEFLHITVDTLTPGALPVSVKGSRSN